MPINGLQPWHLLVIIVVLIVVFGSKRLPDAARSLGKSLRIFKTEIRELSNDGKAETPPTQIPSERVNPPTAEAPHTDARPA
jgi:sec-independent protein translocase protein TatA